MLHVAYPLLTDLAGPALTPWLRLRARRGKEIPERLPERMGEASRPRPEGKLAWFHGASVGEALSLLPLIAKVRTAGWQVLVTTGTVTSAKLLAERLPEGAIHQFIPLDRAAWIARFLDHWRPDLVIWTESELWPNTLFALSARSIPAVLVNARLSDRAFRGWRRWRHFATSTLAGFRLILAQSELDRSRFATLGGRDVRLAGNIKLAAPPLPGDEAALATLRSAIGARPHWLAASIHPGEDAIVAAAHATLARAHSKLLTIIVPRHPERGAAMEAACAAAGARVARRSTGAPITGETDVYIADTMGELGVMYRAADLVFVGKSLSVGGGQNPAEPALLGCALVFGPDMSNFRDTAAMLLQAGGAEQVADAAGLARAVGALLADPARRRTMGDAAKATIAAHSAALDDTWGALAAFIE
jgi:3-deoxy-D-manno-octulosonic-acid transferase